MSSLLLEVQFKNATYKFNFQNNGWISIHENADDINTERFNMGFFRDDHNFTYTGDRDFCVEVCERLIDIIKKEYNFKDNDKEVTLSKEEVLKRYTKGIQSTNSVNFDENSDVGDKGDNLEKKIQDYMNEHKVSYGKAYKVVAKGVNY